MFALAVLRIQILLFVARGRYSSSCHKGEEIEWLFAVWEGKGGGDASDLWAETVHDAQEKDHLHCCADGRVQQLFGTCCMLVYTLFSSCFSVC